MVNICNNEICNYGVKRQQSETWMMNTFQEVTVSASKNNLAVYGKLFYLLILCSSAKVDDSLQREKEGETQLNKQQVPLLLPHIQKSYTNMLWLSVTVHSYQKVNTEQ